MPCALFPGAVRQHSSVDAGCAHGGWGELHISDDGVGIDESRREQVLSRSLRIAGGPGWGFILPVNYAMPMVPA